MKKLWKYYDLLIEDNNDPVYDNETLRIHMDKWDGVECIEALQLSNEISVLEIGVGIRRLATKISPFVSV